MKAKLTANISLRIDLSSQCKSHRNVAPPDSATVLWSATTESQTYRSHEVTTLVKGSDCGVLCYTVHNAM